MANRDESNTSLPSTNWAWKRVKIEPHPQGDQAGRRRRTAGRRSPGTGWLRRQQMVVEYRGGPEASYIIRVNGKTWRYSGALCLHDVMTHVARVLL